MIYAALAAVLAMPPTPIAADAGDWSVKQLQFSAVTIGVAMKDENVGWSSFTNGAQAVQITKTTDGGATWTPVKNQTNVALVMGMAAWPSPLDVVTTGLHSNSHSSDGDVFVASRGAPFVSQSVKAMADGRVAVASGDGACVSSDSGATFKCFKVPFKYGPQGRYVASPSPNVIYVTAGSWPSNTAPTANEHRLTANLRWMRREFGAVARGGARAALEMGPFPTEPSNDNQTYTAEIWKSADGGATWTSLFSDEGKFYFNDIDCFDDTHCVAVAEGFGHDGSSAPGAYVFSTTDGQTFGSHWSQSVDGASLMTVKMLSASEHHVGGRLQGAIGLHTTDGGATYTMKGAQVRGQMITSLSFPKASHGFATSISQLQVCSLLEYA